MYQLFVSPYNPLNPLINMLTSRGQQQKTNNTNCRFFVQFNKFEDGTYSETRMHSSKLRTARFSCHPEKGGVCLRGDVCLGECLPRGCLPKGVSAGACLVGLSAQGGVHLPLHAGIDIPL